METRHICPVFVSYHRGGPGKLILKFIPYLLFFSIYIANFLLVYWANKSHLRYTMYPCIQPPLLVGMGTWIIPPPPLFVGGHIISKLNFGGPPPSFFNKHGRMFWHVVP